MPPPSTDPAAPDGLTDLLRQTLAALAATPAGELDAGQRALLAQLAQSAQSTAPPPGAADARPMPADSAAQRRARSLQAHFDYALNGILESDGHGRIVDANPAAASIFGIERKQLPGQTLNALFAAASQPRLVAHLALMCEQGIAHVELRRQRHAAESTIALSSIQVEEDLYLHVFDDVTEDRRLSLELREARQAAESANAAKGRFLANVSHEIRTPLNGIIGLTQLALLSNPEPRLHDFLEKIAQSGRTLLAMINDLLDFAKIEAGKLVLEERNVDWFAVLDELSPIGLEALAKKPVAVIFDLAPDVPRYLRTDPLRLVQILTNLLGNAIKFTERGQVILRIDCMPGEEAVPVPAAAPDRAPGPPEPTVRITLSDTGPGISPEAQARLFQPFNQEGADTSRRFGGTGLGLAIARQLARALGGDIVLRSTLGQGSIFTVTLPLRPAEEANEPPRPVCPPGTSLALAGNAPAPLITAVLHLLQRLGLDTALPATAGILLQMPERAEDIVLAARPPGQRHALLLPAHLRFTAAGQVDRSDIILPMPLTPNALLRACQPAAAARDEPAPPLPDADLPTEFRGACVAVAEDMPVNQEVIRGLLERVGIQVLLADNGRALLARLAEAATPPELILMDIHMPELDGLATTRALRERGYRQPVVALSAGIGREEQAQCLAAGMSDFLAKPIDIDELWGVLTCWLPPRAPEATPPSPLPSSPPAPVSGPPGEADDLPAPLRAQLTAAGINLTETLPRFLGDTTAVRKSIALFCAQHAGTVAQMAQAVTDADAPRFRALAHGLRGSALTVGAETLAAHCRAAEYLNPEAWPSAATALIPELAQAFARIAALSPHLD